MGCVPNISDCAGWPFDCPLPRADLDIAGLGVMIGFCGNALLTLIASLALHLLPSFAKLLPQLEPYTTDTKRIYLEKYIVGLGDQQLLLGLLMSVVAFAKFCSISIYHLEIVGELLWFSATTHLASMVVLRKYFKKSPHLLWLRLSLILMFGIFLAMFMLWIGFLGPGINGSEFGRGSFGCSARCAWEQPIFFKHLRDPTLRAKLSALDIFYSVLPFVEFLFLIFGFGLSIGPYFREILEGWNKLETGTLVFLLISWIIVTAIIFYDRGPGQNIEGSENEWGFGQVLPVTLIALPFWQALTA
ncbi:hypothetical protein BP6252_00457 [Coleophoma cylindrospora]|uniref:Uncharacterized protein n=1 Tax=Coleophoma cylindrospora TaxID=1849047 RepID=A0A3D8SQ35_9HELO|nr:hypothetical protein BP6252_00457 [Coleophoma cylindrospora]